MAKTFAASAASATTFLTAMDLGEAPGDTLEALGVVPMRALLPAGAGQAALAILADAVAAGQGAGQPKAAAPPAGGAKPAAAVAAGAPGAAGAAAQPDPQTLGGDIDLRNQVQQSFAVGSGIVSFDQGVTSARKSAAINSTLLAQLYADQLYPDKAAASYSGDWYASYFNTLLNLGWVLQGDAQAKTFTGGKEADINQAVITLAAALVGANAVAAIKAVLDSLSKLADSNSIITLFKQSSQTNKLAQFSISLAAQDAAADFSITGLAFDLQATASETQVLFFKWKAESVTMNWRNIQLTIDDDVYPAADVAAKIGPFVKSFVKEIVLTPPAPPS